MKRCPFCGRPPSDDLIDTLYPTGIEWADYPLIRGYVGHLEGQASGHPWGRVWKMGCNETEGGCGAQVQGDSKEEAIAAWERRSTTEEE